MATTMSASAQTSAVSLNSDVTAINAKRRTLSLVLLAAIALVFWVDSRYPALMKRYHAGTQVKVAGSLTFGTVCAVDRSLPLSTRVWRTTVNWLDANGVGMT